MLQPVPPVTPFTTCNVKAAAACCLPAVCLVLSRCRNDNQINNRKVLRLTADKEQELYWKDVVQGDLIKVCYHLRA